MGHRLFDFSGDVGVEGESATPEEALVELARGLSQVLTDGSAIQPSLSRRIDIEEGPDLASTAVAFLNELIFLFDTDQFLVADGRLTRSEGRLRGTLRGEAFDKVRHRSGRGVKAATFHDALHDQRGSLHRLRVVLDL